MNKAFVGILIAFTALILWEMYADHKWNLEVEAKVKEKVRWRDSDRDIERKVNDKMFESWLNHGMVGPRPVPRKTDFPSVPEIRAEFRDIDNPYSLFR